MTIWLLVMVLVAALSAVGHLLFKLSALRPTTWRRRLFNPLFLGGCASFGLAPVLTFMAARNLDFSVLYAMTALNFIFVMILSRFVLGEPLDRPKWLGVGGIVLGLVVFLV